MNPMEEKKQVEPYAEVPCAGCGEHYWKIPNKEGEQHLRCPKCKRTTHIAIGKEFRVYEQS